MGFIESTKTVEGNHRVVYGIASGIVNHTSLRTIIPGGVQLTPLATSGEYSVSVSASGSFTVAGVTGANYAARIIGY